MNRDLPGPQLSNPLQALAEGVPRLRLRLEDGTGKQLGEPIEIRIPRELSFRVAKMYLLEMVVKLIKAALPAALKEMGFK